MRNQFFDPGFVFDLYSDRESTATPSARSDNNNNNNNLDDIYSAVI